MSASEIANTEKPIVEVTAADGTRVVFRSLDELERWLNDEQTFWAFLSGIGGDGTPGEFLGRQNMLDAQLRATIANAKQQSPPQVEDNLQTIRAWLAQRYAGDNRALMASSSAAIYGKALAEREPLAAAYALWYLAGLPPRNSNTQSEFTGRVLATLFQQGIGKDAKPLTEAWNALQGRVTKEHEVLRAEAGRMQDDFRKTEQQIRELHSIQGTQYNETQAKREVEFTTLVTDHKTRMGNIEATFKKDLSLRSAVQYLTARAKAHRWFAIGSGIAAGLTGIAFAILTVRIGHQIFSSTGREVSHYELAVGVLIGTLAFWLLRILVRMFLSNLHLSTDMRTRATFVHTYLALIAEGGAIKEEDRAMIIGLVFRPTSDGLVRDDATPPGLWDLLSKRAAG